MRGRPLEAAAAAADACQSDRNESAVKESARKSSRRIVRPCGHGGTTDGDGDVIALVASSHVDKDEVGDGKDDKEGKDAEAAGSEGIHIEDARLRAIGLQPRQDVIHGDCSYPTVHGQLPTTVCDQLTQA